MAQLPIIQAYSDWLDKIPWDFWCTLTFRYDPTPRAALRAFHTWLDQSEFWYRSDYYGFVVTEDGRLNGRTHLHALMGTLGHLEAYRKELWREWHQRFGRARLEPYDKGKGASGYIAKYITKELGEWEVIGSWPQSST